MKYVIDTAAKAKFVLMLLAGVCLAGTGATFAVQQPVTTDPDAKRLLAAEQANAPGPSPREKAHVDPFGDPLPPEAIARLGTMRLQHRLPPSAIAFAPDGKSLASGGVDGLVHIWRSDTGQELLRMATEGYPPGMTMCYSVAYAPDGKTLALARKYNQVCLWDATTGKLIRKFGAENHEAAWVVFSPDGKSLAYGGQRVGKTDPIVRLADVKTGKDIRLLGGHRGFVTKVAFSPDGSMLASADDEVIRVFDLATGRARALPQPDDKSVRFSSLAFSPDGKTLAAASEGSNIIRLMEVATGNAIHTIKFAGKAVNEVLFSPDGKMVISGDDDGVVGFWEVGSGRRIRQFRAYDVKVVSAPGMGARGLTLALSPDGQTLATCCYSNEDHAVRLWETATGKPLARYLGPQQAIHDVAFSPDATRVATSSLEGVVHVWDAATGQLLQQWKRHGALVFVPGSQLLICGSWTDGDVYFLDVATGKETRQFSAHAKGVHKICLSRDGKILVTAGRDDFIRLWHLHSGKQLQDFGGRQQRRETPDVPGVGHVALSPDAKLLASTARGNLLRLWETASGKLVREQHVPNYLYNVAFSPDGKLLAYETGRVLRGAMPMVHLVDIATGAEIRQLKWDSYNRSVMMFSPDSRTLIWGNALWEIATGQKRRIFPWHEQVCCVACSRNGQLLASGDSDACALVWDATGQRGRQKPPAFISAARLDALWNALGALNAPTGYEAMCALRGASQQGVQLFEQHLKPVPRADAKRVADALGDLDSPQFAVRSQATQELEKLGEAAEGGLRRTLGEKTSLEMRQRVERLLDRLGGARRLRQTRALEVLEQIGNPEARRLLTELAGGSPEAGLTLDARAVLDRLRN